MVRTIAVLALMVMGLAESLVAAPADVVNGTLLIGEKTYKLNQAVAYQTKTDDESWVSVVLSDRNIPTDKIKAALREGEGSDKSLRLAQPHLLLVFQTSGEIDTCRIGADNTMFNGRGDSLEGELELANGRVLGQAKMHDISPLKTVTSFDIQFNVKFGLDTVPQAPSAAPGQPAKPSLSGTFIGNGKSARLTFVSARRGDSFNDEPLTVLVFAEKNLSKDSKPEIRAGVGDYGSALILSVLKDGSVVSCQVVHPAHKKSGFSTTADIRAAAFEVSSGRVSGHFTTDGQKTTFGETWSVDLKFVAPFQIDVPTRHVPTPSATPDRTDPSGATSVMKPSPGKSADASGTVNVRKLPFPADVTNIEYKQLVQQIVFHSENSVQKLAGSFSKALASQGWKPSGVDLVTPNSAILNVTHGDATLTIMVKSSGNGSQTTIFAQGLNWEEQP